MVMTILPWALAAVHPDQDLVVPDGRPGDSGDREQLLDQAPAP